MPDRRDRNGRLPVHQLPVELFMEIIFYAANPVDQNTRLLIWLSGVCSHWRDALFACPHLWPATISDFNPPSINKFLLDRNPVGPLKVYFCWQMEGYFRDKDYTATSFMADTGRYSRRFHTLDFGVDGDPSSYHWDWLSLPMPFLEDLTLSSIPDTGYEAVVVDLSWVKVSHLRRLHAQSVTLSWSSLANLQALEITQVGRGAPTIDQMLEVLSSSPQLERLVLSDWSQIHAETSPPVSLAIRPIELPLLRTVSMDHIPDWIVERLDLAIRAPACDRVTLIPFSPPVGMALALSAVRNAAESSPLKLSAQSRSDYLTIRIDPVPWRVFGNSYGPGFSCEIKYSRFSEPPYAAFVLALQSVIGQIGCTSFELDGEFAPSTKFLLDLLPQIDVIRVVAGWEGTLSVCDYLATPEIGLDGITRFPRPALKALDLSECRASAEDIRPLARSYLLRRHVSAQGVGGAKPIDILYLPPEVKEEFLVGEFAEYRHLIG